LPCKAAGTTIARMWTTLLLVFAIALGVIWWMLAREAAERARAIARGICRQAGVQLLDQTVTLRRVRLARASDGWLKLRRRYAFDFSRDGATRETGTVTLLGASLEAASMPTAPWAAMT
jgi:hypothetical protein